MSWNYRVMRHVDPGGDETFAIHEVFYEGHSAVVRNWATDGEATSDTLAGIKDVLAMMAAALEKPVLDDKTGKAVSE